MKKLKVGAITFGIVIILNQLFALMPEVYEILYFRGIYQVLRVVHDFTSGLLPVPNVYLIAPAYIIYFFYKSFSSLKSFMFSFINCTLWTLNWFYILWGFNYNQIPVHEDLGLVPVEIDTSYIEKEFMAQTVRLNHLADISRSDTFSYHDLEKHIRDVQESLLSSWGYPVAGRVRVRKLIPGLLLHLRTSGIYIPHALEGHIDNGLYFRQQPFTLAHEMAHGYGFTDESVCNFIAYLTAIRSGHPDFLYSAEIAYWRYLAQYYRRQDPETYNTVLGQLNPVLKSDLEEIRQHVLRYRDLMPRYRDKIYDSYLKKHGIEAGISSYNQLIHLIAGYRQSGMVNPELPPR